MQRNALWTATVAAALVGANGIASAGEQDGSPSYLYLQNDGDDGYESVYAPPAPPSEEEGRNEGGVEFGLAVSYMTDYVFRGIERFDGIGESEDIANLQFLGQLEFDLGKLPHPVAGLFVNTQESDPVSNFQEIRPFIGLEWSLRPLLLTGGHNSYIFPDRDELDTTEIFGKIQLDDSFFLVSDQPFLSPYIYGAYDYELYNGWYIEAGVEHDFVLDDLGIVLTAQAHVAYARNYELLTETGDDESGFQHYQVGLIGNYSLNQLLNFSQRYGEWSLIGYIYYTDGMDNDLRADSQIWGGAGIGFKY